MAERTISVVMESSYRSGLAKGLRQDKRKLDEFQKFLDRRPLRVPVRLDLKGIASQAEAMRKIVLGEFAKMPASILGADGRPTATGASSGKATNARAGLLSRTTSTTYDRTGAPKTQVSELEQLGKGLSETNKYKAGSNKPFATITKDISNVNELRDALRGMNDALRAAYGTARGRGDKAGQIDALTQHKALLTSALQSASGKGLENSPHYIQAENQVSRVSERIAALQGGQQSKAEKEASSRFRNRFDNALRREEERVDIAQKANSQELIRANQIADLTRRESELNRLYAERKRIFSDSQGKFQQIDAWRQGRGDAAGADKAMRRGLNMAGHAAQVDVEQTRAQASLAAHRSAERKAEDAKGTSDRAAAFNRELQDIKANSDKRLAAINATEREEKAAAKNAATKTAAAEKGHRARQAEYGNRATQYAGVDARARAAGNVPVADAARAGRLRSEVAGARDLTRFAAASNAGGHALNFHSSALLRNAATYIRWMVPVQAVMAMTSAFSAGVAGVVKVDRQFATLRAVFRGTDQEAQRLKVDTLELGVAQGRSAEEAMDASIRWSRLGLNRVQVLQATKVSLMAANVAEMTAAEAAEKLSAIYATYRLNVGDLPVVLSRLNAISNRYNVTNKDLLEGIVRVAGVAKEAGLELRDLEGMIGAVTGATGRPGQEVGNALKFVVTRLAAPETMEGLKKNFDIDLTGPNGDLKGMSQIFRELASIYPTLNNAQKQYFLKLTAGSRQAARFALVLDQYRQSQILAAEAGFDTSSAFRENEKILASLQSRVDALTTSWTKLFTAIGDAGGFDLAGSVASGLTDFVKDTSTVVSKVEAGVGSDKGTISKLVNSHVRRTTSNLANPLGLAIPGFGYMKEAFQYAWNYGKGQDPAKTADAEAVSKMTDNVNALRERMGGLERASHVFESMNIAIREGSIDRKTMVRDFESGAHLLLNLENGSNRYADAVSRFYKLLEAGDTGGLQKLMLELQTAFKGGADSTQGQFEKAVAPAVAMLRDQLKAFDEQRRKLLETKDDGSDVSRRAKADQIEKIQAGAKAAQGAIEQLTQAQEKFNKAAYGPKPVAAINRYMDELVGGSADNAEERVKALAAAFGDALKSLAPDADNDPVERIFARRRSAESIGRGWLMDVQHRTNLQAEAGKNAAAGMIENAKAGMASGSITSDQAQKEIAFWQTIINQMDEANLMVRTRILLEDERLKKATDELSVQQQVAALVRIQTDASKAAATSSLAWRFGETESDKDSNQAAAAIARGRATMVQAEDLWFTGSKTEDTPAARAALAGRILQDEATARTALESMQRRQYELAAATRQVEFDTLKAVREQTEEASKRLMLASREDQLRAAALARTLRDRPVRSSEFYALSQETRQAMVNYLPNDAPGRLNPAREARDKSLAELGEEKVRLTSAIGEIARGLEDLSKRITRDTGSGLPLDVAPGSPGKSVQEAALTRDNSPVVTVSIGSVAVSVQMAQQVERLLTGYVDRKMAADLGAMEARLARPAAPSAQGIVE